MLVKKLHNFNKIKQNQKLFKIEKDAENQFKFIITKIYDNNLPLQFINGT